LGHRTSLAVLPLHKFVTLREAAMCRTLRPIDSFYPSHIKFHSSALFRIKSNIGTQGVEPRLAAQLPRLLQREAAVHRTLRNVETIVTNTGI
jgi:hypothetical protein